MIKQYIKQSIQMLKENRLVSVISIAGTAISIAMIMVVVLVFQIQFANFYPENNRDRMMYVDSGTEVKTSNGWNRGNMSPEAVKECFYSLEIPEAVSGYAMQLKPLSIPGKRMYKGYQIKYTDTGFWKVFSFRFLTGKPFTQADFDSGITQAVVSESVARKLYGTTDVVGKTVIIDLTTYTVCGVVKDVSRAADTAFGDVWVPYTTDRILMTNTSSENMAGWFSICLLAKDSRDFEAIRHELLKQIERYNGMKQDAKINFFENPITRFDIAIGSIGQRKVDVKDYLLETGSLLLFLLLVPALNLLGVTQSAVQKRRAEMGVRKAFGATYGVLVRQILYENSVITLIGGLVGLSPTGKISGLYRLKGFIIDNLLDSLKQNKRIVQYIYPPKSPSIDLSNLHTYYRGNLQSKVSIIIISDFDCESCINAHNLYETIYQKYKEKVKFGYIHYSATPTFAQIASEAANRQNKFWEFHDSLYTHKGYIDSITVYNIAHSTSMDINKFKKDIEDDAGKKLIEKSINQLVLLGVYATPTIIVNGRLIVNSNSKREICHLIDEELSK